MSREIQCDIAIIGAGTGGLTCAAGAAQLGAKVVLIESDKMGGDCLNDGCVPSKSLLAAAKAVDHVKKAKYFGGECDSIKLNFEKVKLHIKNVIATLYKNDSVARFESLGVQVIRAEAKFINAKTVQAGETIIHAKRFVIATGSTPFIPPIPGLDQVSFETNETIFDVDTLPEHLIVIGGGPIGCELAQAFAMLGSQVSIVEGRKILPKDDPDCVSVVREQFKKEGIQLCENTKVESVKQAASNKIIITVEIEGVKKNIEGTHLLVATGRRPNVNGLDLEKADVKDSPKGIEVDTRLRSSNKRIFAVGDVAGGYQFTHIAHYHAGIVLRNIVFRWPAKINYHAVPWVTYTSPEIAHVGLTQEEAEKRGEFQITEWPFEENDRAHTEHETLGKIKIITNRKGKILGVTIVGANAGELILPWVMAVREKRGLRSFTDVIVPYPTLSEISKRVASEFYAPKLFSNKIRKLARFFLKFP